MSGIKAYLALHDALARVGVPSSLGFLRTQLAETIKELREWEDGLERARGELELYTSPSLDEAATDELESAGWVDPKRPDFYALAEKASKRDSRVDIDKEADRLEEEYGRSADGARFAAAVKVESKAADKAYQLLDNERPLSSEVSGELLTDLRDMEREISKSIKSFEKLKSKLPLLAGGYKP